MTRKRQKSPWTSQTIQSALQLRQERAAAGETVGSLFDSFQLAADASAKVHGVAADAARFEEWLAKVRTAAEGCASEIELEEDLVLRQRLKYLFECYLRGDIPRPVWKIAEYLFGHLRRERHPWRPV